MKKNYLIATAMLLLAVSSCKHDDTPHPQCGNDALKQKTQLAIAPQGQPLSQSKIDSKMKELLESKHDFDWSMMDLTYLWSAIQYGNQSVAIGYKPSDEGDISGMIHKINLNDKKWKGVHDALIELVVNEVNKAATKKVTAQDIIIEDDNVLPIITFTLSDANAITALYNLENVRYIEPLDYHPSTNGMRVESSSGCGGSTQALNATDYTTIAPNCRLPWNYNNLNIPTAWNTAQGAGIKIGIIDAGISSTQTLLGSQFNNGYSSAGRTITTDYTYGTSAYTTCTHGTSMSGLAAGPRNDQNAVTGVAYKANLHFIHGCEDVLLDASAEKTGVKNALVRMGDISDLKIISMSVGWAFGSNVLKDGCTYAYNKGKMIFAAAGTSYSFTSWWGVIYPAAYSQCIAVTGVKESGSTCSDCHDGSQVKFTIPMERNASSARTSLSLALNGTAPTYIGGSSAATATTAGIAALVWSAKPTLTREQVLTIMSTTAQFPASTSSHGYGNPNAGSAVALALTY